MRRSRSVALVMVAVFLWSTVPVAAAGKDKKRDVDAIGERRVAHRSIISQEKEIAAGKMYATEIDRSAKLLKDEVVNEYVNRLAQNVARNSDLTIPLTVKVIDSPELNAFALPGGFLYVNSGLIMAADEESQVAGVVAHEIAHVAARHWASQMTKATLLQYALIPLIFTPMSYPVYMGVSSALNFGIPLAFLKFTRGAEAEADLLGLQYMYKAGYDPSAYVTFFSKIIEQGEDIRLIDVIKQSRSEGMIDFGRSLYDLIKAGWVSEEEALTVATNPQALRGMLEGVFVSESSLVR